METVNLLIVFAAAWLVWKRPLKEDVAYRLLVVSVLFTAVLYFIGTRTSVLPRFNF